MIAEDWRYSNLSKIQGYIAEGSALPFSQIEESDFLFMLENLRKIGSVVSFKGGKVYQSSSDYTESEKSVVLEDHPMLEFNKKESLARYTFSLDSTSEKPIFFVYMLDAPIQAYQIEINLKNNANIIEFFLSSSNTKRAELGSVLTEITLSPGAKLRHAVIGNLEKKTRISHFLNVVQHQNSAAEFFNLSLAGEWARFDVRNYLRDPGAKSNLGGLYLKSENEFVDHCTKIFHEAPNTESQQLYKGVLGGNSRAIFNGIIKIDEGCPESKTNQLNKNLIVSKKAEVISRPQLEILTDNVKANHGMTIGSLNPNEIFYLTSRGISEEMAHDMLADAFVNEVVDQYVGKSISSMVKGLIASSWPQLRGELR